MTLNGSNESSAAYYTSSFECLNQVVYLLDIVVLFPSSPTLLYSTHNPPPVPYTRPLHHSSPANFLHLPFSSSLLQLPSNFFVNAQTVGFEVRVRLPQLRVIYHVIYGRVKLKNYA